MRWRLGGMRATWRMLTFDRAERRDEEITARFISEERGDFRIAMHVTEARTLCHALGMLAGNGDDDNATHH